MRKCFLLFISLFAINQSNASDAQVEAYLKAINHPYREVSFISANSIYDIPLVSDARLFSKIAGIVRPAIDGKLNTTTESKRISILLKSLSASGDEQYLDLLKQGKKKFEHDYYTSGQDVNAERALSHFHYFQGWQNLIHHIDFDRVEDEAAIGKVFLDALKNESVGENVKLYSLRTLYNYGKVDYPSLYDYLGKEVYSQYDRIRNRRKIEDKLFSWKLKALIAAGDKKDKPELERLFLKFKKLRKTSYLKHIKNYAVDVDNFAIANESIALIRQQNPGATRLATIWAGLVSSSVTKFKLHGVREAFNAHRFDPVIMDAVMKDMNASINITKKNRILLQYQAWACKYLASSGRQDAFTIIERFYESSPFSYVRGHAKEQLKVYKKLGLLKQ